VRIDPKQLAIAILNFWRFQAYPHGVTSDHTTSASGAFVPCSCEKILVFRLIRKSKFELSRPKFPTYIHICQLRIWIGFIRCHFRPILCLCLIVATDVPNTCFYLLSRSALGIRGAKRNWRQDQSQQTFLSCLLSTRYL